MHATVGREMLGSGGRNEGPLNGENEGPLHRDDSTFGEYMAALERKSSSGNGVRRLHSSGGPAFKFCQPRCITN